MEGPSQVSTGAAERPLNKDYELEKLDAHHRYGLNLKLYRDLWGKNKTVGDFFKWLDEGVGRNYSHPQCSRFELDRQRVRYLDDRQRMEFEVIVEKGKIRRRSNGEFVDTNGKMHMYVLSPSNCLYIGEKVRGVFHHSSFLAGGNVLCAGLVKVDRGNVTALSRRSGHYRPKSQNFQLFMGFLEEKEVDMKHVEIHD